MQKITKKDVKTIVLTCGEFAGKATGLVLYTIGLPFITFGEFCEKKKKDNK